MNPDVQGGAWTTGLVSHQQSPATGPDGGFSSSLVMMILIFGIFYFLVIRPQNKSRDAHRNMLASLKKGDQVETDGGIFGTIWELSEDKVILEVSPKVRMTFRTASVKARTGDEETS